MRPPFDPRGNATMHCASRSARLHRTSRQSLGCADCREMGAAAMTKRIGVLTSGGDCAGLNTAIRAVVAHASGGYGWTVVGIRQGTAGLLARPAAHEILELDRLPAQLHRLGGTILGTTNTGNPFAF